MLKPEYHNKTPPTHQLSYRKYLIESKGDKNYEILYRLQNSGRVEKRIS